jgi:hypothetical protein
MTNYALNLSVPAGQWNGTCSLTEGSTTVVDSSCLAAYEGTSVSGGGIPANTTVVSVTPGVSFVISNPAEITNSSVYLTLSGVSVIELFTASGITPGKYAVSSYNDEGDIQLANDSSGGALVPILGQFITNGDPVYFANTSNAVVTVDVYLSAVPGCTVSVSC